MSILRKIIALTLVTLAIFILSSGTQIKSLSSWSLNNSKIANVIVIFFETDDPYTMRVIESFKEIEGKEQNRIKYTFPNPKNNIAINSEILVEALQSDYDLFILYLPDTRENAVEDVINRVRQRNKPLILMNIPTEVVAKVSKIYEKVAFVTPDSKKAGIAQGNIIVNLWNSNNKLMDKNNDNVLQYVLLKGPANDPQVADRTNYAISTINNSGIKTQEISVVGANWSRDLARTSIDNLFLKYDGSIEAIISNNDAMAIGAIEALQKYGYNKGDKSRNIVVVGVDGLPEAKDLIDKGIMAGTVIQDPKVQAELLNTVGMNLINNLKPTENTNYKIVDGQIIIPFPYDIYTGKTSNP
ncbi:MULTISPECIES: galactose ABC transporter substrate-binding protein [unclassified Clostridium]|uniref:galactose ABC transporter substrate-binding protein n=1 Tax=unclassified Clostridium TaxID=2614128 RepID=UPI00029741C2|nr:MULTISPECIES: galactose ABC transporter substrate-binding protein [unclassified Clostridium]EKQ57358.1 MAG: ABC-type sugar transport system, periplasmic component [Clostridium sp. Maddingley MBC34-26]